LPVMLQAAAAEAKAAPAVPEAMQFTCVRPVVQVAPRQQTPLATAHGLGLQEPPADHVPVQRDWKVLEQVPVTQQVPSAGQEDVGVQVPAGTNALVTAHWVARASVQVPAVSQHAPGCGQVLGVQVPLIVQKVPVEKQAACVLTEQVPALPPMVVPQQEPVAQVEPAAPATPPTEAQTLAGRRTHPALLGRAHAPGWVWERRKTRRLLKSQTASTPSVASQAKS
jgi:hypothetical protein